MYQPPKSEFPRIPSYDAVIAHYGREAKAVRRQLDASWRQSFAMAAIIVATILLIGAVL